MLRVLRTHGRNRWQPTSAWEHTLRDAQASWSRTVSGADPSAAHRKHRGVGKSKWVPTSEPVASRTGSFGFVDTDGEMVTLSIFLNDLRSYAAPVLRQQIYQSRSVLQSGPITSPSSKRTSSSSNSLPFSSACSRTESSLPSRSCTLPSTPKECCPR